MSVSPLVSIDRLSKRFAGGVTPALECISAQIYSGHMFGLVGPDGAGKTTLMRLIAGLLQVDSGSITVDGLDVQVDTERCHEILGYMPQQFGLYEDLTVIENLTLYADLRNIPAQVRQRKFETLLNFTSLNHCTTRLAGKLSGGMKQKLGLACALIGEPKLLLLDEPSVGVDPISRRELWKMVKEMLSEGMAVVWSTAYLDEAEKCDTVLLLNEGQQLYSGFPNDILQRVAGRTFHIRGVADHRRRAVLLALLRQDGVIDGVIQGKHIRIVLAKDAKKPVLEEGAWHPVPPWFEDAFIDALGGGPGGHSAIAEQIKVKPGKDEAVIAATGLRKCFGNFTAVTNSSFSVRRGEIFGLLGPNGAGKSTTFKLLCGLLQPTQGSAFVTGLDLKTATAQARSRIGYMAQKFSLYGNLNARQNLKFFSGLYGLSGSVQRQQVDTMIRIFDLEAYLEQNARLLPLGFQQRLALACAVMHEPDVLFLDEPTSGVDPITRREFWLHINGMVEKGVTVMVTTHFMDEAEYCDRIALINQGTTIATGTPDDLKESIKSAKNQKPTLEDTFVELVRRHSDATKVVE
jgi:drug efflux transport system ATP-binding protein